MSAPDLTSFKEFDVTTLPPCSCCMSRCCLPSMYASTHDSYFEHRTTSPSPMGSCCGTSTSKTLSPYAALDHLVLQSDCTCWGKCCPQCCFRYGCCPFYPTINMGWRDGMAFMGPTGAGAAYNFWVGTGPVPAKELHDVLEARIRCANIQGALALVDDSPDRLVDTSPTEFASGLLQIYGNCLHQTRTTCCCCVKETTTMYESIKFAHHKEWCCCNCCPAQFRATNKFDELIHSFDDGCCSGSKVSSSVYEKVSAKMGEDAARMAGTTRTPDPDKTYLITSCCWIKDSPMCPQESYTLKQDTFEYKKIQVAQPLFTCFTPVQLACFFTLCWCPNLFSCGMLSMCCTCWCPACKTERTSMKYADISQINQQTCCFPCCCMCGDGFFEVRNSTSGPMAVSCIPGKCLGTFCCHSSNLEDFTDELVRRSAGTTEDKAAIAAITDAGRVHPPAPEKPAEMSVAAPGVRTNAA